MEEDRPTTVCMQLETSRAEFSHGEARTSGEWLVRSAYKRVPVPAIGPVFLVLSGAGSLRNPRSFSARRVPGSFVATEFSFRQAYHAMKGLSEDLAFRKRDLEVADQCRLNVLWLNGAASGSRALEIAVRGPPLTEALRSLFESVDQVQLRVDEARLEEREGRIPFPGGSFDLVTVYGREPSLSGLREIRRVLRTGGSALIAVDNRWWYGRLRRHRRSIAASVAGLGLGQLIVAAGFNDVRPYWVEPSLATPRNVIPARRDPVRAFESIRAREFGKDLVRSIAVSSHMHRVLYPAVLFVAKV